MVANCLPDATEISSRKCTDVGEEFSARNIPVVGSDLYLYKNAECAKCNGVYNFSYYQKISATNVSMDRVSHIWKADRLSSGHIAEKSGDNLVFR